MSSTRSCCWTMPVHTTSRPTKPNVASEMHPHRGFETVTILYQGELEHRDSSGGHGTIGPGDVQWMTAASGIVHEEFHSRGFAKSGGTLEMIQLRVNLPAQNKQSPPKYQDLRDEQFPKVALPGNVGTARVIAGEFMGATGPASTFTPINVWDVHLVHQVKSELHVPEGHTCCWSFKAGASRSMTRSSRPLNWCISHAPGVS